jgi:MFS transporter, ACS family, D-galactonate transporter
MSSSRSEHAHLTTTLRLVVILLGLSVFINYIDRGNLSIAAPMLKDELGISSAQLGFLLSAFFWTYACLQPVTGWLVDRLNVKWVFAGGFALWSVATATIGIAHAFVTLFALRLLLGIGEAVAFPSYTKIIALHIPEEHRGFANSIVTAGLALGPGLGVLAGGELMARFGWRAFFIVLGLGSLIWLIPWIKFMPNRAELPADTVLGAPSLPEFLRLRSAWGTCLGLFCGNYLNYFLITWLPFYLVHERNFSMQKMAKVGGIAYLCAAGAAMATGWLSDRWIMAGGTPTQVRKTVVAGGLALSGIFLALAAFGGPVQCIVMLILGMTFFGVGASNVWAITQTLAGPHAAGRWSGFQLFVGNMSGVVAPAVTGIIVQRTGHFYLAFVMLAVAALVGASIWMFLVGQVEQVVWNRTPKAVAVAA